MASLTTSALALLVLVLVPLLSPPWTVGVNGQYAAQQYPSPLPSALPANCTPLTASSALVALYGSQYIGQCAFSFCYQLYTTPFPNQDPSAQAYSASGFLFTSSTTSVLTTGYSWLDKSFPTNNVAFNVTGIVGQRQQRLLDWNGTCAGNATLTAAITGLTPNNANTLSGGKNDNYLLTGYPYFTLAGLSYNINATYNDNWNAAASTNSDHQPVCNVRQLQIAAVRSTQAGATNLQTNMVAPISGVLSEWNIGLTNFAKVRVQAWIEGSSTSYPTCPTYEAPVLTAMPVSYKATVSVTQTFITAILSYSTCFTGTAMVHGPYQRISSSTSFSATAVPYDSYVVSAVTGMRYFTNAHNSTTVTNIVGVTQPPHPGPDNVQQLYPALSNTFRLWTDNAFHFATTGIPRQMFVSANGIGWTTDTLPVGQAGLGLPQGTAISNWFVTVGNQASATTFGEYSSYISPSSTVLVPLTLLTGTVAGGAWAWNNTVPAKVCFAGQPTPMALDTFNLADKSYYTQMVLVHRQQTGYQNLQSMGVSPAASPAYGECTVALVTLDLTTALQVVPLSGPQQPAYYGATVANLTGWRTFASANGTFTVSRLATVPPTMTQVLFNVITNQPSLTLPFIDPLYSTGGLLNQSTIAIQQQSTAGIFSTNPFVDGSTNQRFYYVDSPASLSMIKINGASTYDLNALCSQSAAVLPLATGFTSPVSLPASANQRVELSYFFLPTSFMQGNQWAVCGSVTLTVSATAIALGTATDSYGQFFAATGASGFRAFIDFDRNIANVSQVTGVAAPYTVSSSGLQPDNAISLLRPYLSLNGLVLSLDSVPTFSTGAVGPASVVLGVRHTYPTGNSPSVVIPNYSELSSPDSAATQSIFFNLQTTDTTSESEHECNALVTAVQSNQGRMPTMTVPFAYSIVNGADTTYDRWTVCVTGQLTVLSTPISISAVNSTVYIVTGATGTRSFFDSTGNEERQNIIGLASNHAVDNNLVYWDPTNKGNYFPFAGLTLQFDSPVNVVNEHLVVEPTVLTVTTSLSGNSLVVTESVYSSISNSMAYNMSLQLAGVSTNPLTTCPAVDYPVEQSTTLQFVFRSAQAASGSTVCASGTLTVGNTVLVNVTGTGYFPVLTASGFRVFTDISGQSFVQNITGVAPPASVPAYLTTSYTTQQSNNNRLGLINGTLFTTSGLIAATPSQFLLALTLDGSPYYPVGITGYLNYWIVQSFQGSVVDSFYAGQTPANNRLYVLTPGAAQSSPSLQQFFQCAITQSSSPQIVPNPETLYYYFYNHTMNGLQSECISGSMRLSASVKPTSTGQYSYSITSINGTRLFYDENSNITYSNTVVGLYTGAGATLDNSLTMTSPFVTNNGFGLQFGSNIPQPFNPNDQLTGTVSSNFNWTGLQYVSSSGVQEIHQFNFFTRGSVFNLSTDSALMAQCNANTVAVQQPEAWHHIVYWINGSYSSDTTPYSFCGSLLVEYDPTVQDANGFYHVLSVQGNRTWIDGAYNSVPQTQVVLGLATPSMSPGGYGDNLFKPVCPFLDTSGIDFEVSCPSCRPAGQSPVNLYRSNAQCDSFVNEGQWWHTFPYHSYNMQGAPWTPGSPLPLAACPIGALAQPPPSAGGSGSLPPLGPPASWNTLAFAYAVQGAPLSVTSPSPNVYGSWVSMVSGVLAIDPTPVYFLNQTAYRVIGASGTRTFVQGKGTSVYSQSIVNGTGYVLANLTYPAASIILRLSESTQSPAGIAYGNILMVSYAANATLANNTAITPPSGTLPGAFSVAEQWTAGGGSNSSYIDTVNLLPFTTTTSQSAASALLPSVAAVQASIQSSVAAQAVPNLPLSNGLTVSFRYSLSPIGLSLASSTSNTGSTSVLWQVCASGTLTVDTTQPVFVSGAVRYPVTSIRGQRRVTQLNASLASVVQAYQLSGGNGAAPTVALTSDSTQTITALTNSYAQGADNLIALQPANDTTTTSSSGTSAISILPTSGGLGFVLDGMSVYPITGASYSNQVTLKTTTALSYTSVVSSFIRGGMPSYFLTEVNGASSTGAMLGAVSPAAAPTCTSVAPALPAAQSYLLVLALNFTGAPSTTAYACSAVIVNVTGVSFPTGAGSAQAIFSARGVRFTVAAGSNNVIQEPITSVSSSTVANMIYASALQPIATDGIVDSNGVTFVTGSNSEINLYYDPSSRSYRERGQTMGTSSQYVTLAPLTTSQWQPALTQSLCSAAAPLPPSSSTGVSTAASSSSSSSSLPGSTSSSSSSSTAAIPSSSSAAASSSTPPTVSQSSSSSTAANQAPSSSSSSSVASSSTSSSATSSAAMSTSSSSSSSSSSRPASSVSSTVSSSSSSSGVSDGGGSDSSLSGGTIAGIVIGVVVGFFLLVAACVFILLTVCWPKGANAEKSGRAPVASSSQMESSQTYAAGTSDLAAAEPSQSHMHGHPMADTDRDGIELQAV